MFSAHLVPHKTPRAWKMRIFFVGGGPPCDGMYFCVRLSQAIWCLNVDMVHHHALQVAQTVHEQLLLLC